MVEGEFVFPICNHILTDLASGEVVQHKALFTGVHHLAIDDGMIFFDQAQLIAELLHQIQMGFSDWHGSILIGEPSSCRNQEGFDSLRIQHLLDLYWITLAEFGKRCALVEILVCHDSSPQGTQKPPHCRRRGVGVQAVLLLDVGDAGLETLLQVFLAHTLAEDDKDGVITCECSEDFRNGQHIQGNTD